MGDTLPLVTTQSDLPPTLTVNGPVLLRISTRSHRSSRSTHSPQSLIQLCFELRRVNIAVLAIRVLCKIKSGGGDILQPLCLGFRRENLEIFADAIHASINEQLIQIYNSFFDFRLKCRVGILGFERRQQSGVFDRSFSVVLWTSMSELRKYRGSHSYKY
ncbi:hypothetical protein V1477_016226 [Vespula maculifrons]|uniref:Uncharacterized protein n=1 Tax=Vespula maculifrons TaxID=7453 RepID=A0ABD2BCF4_VESMC